MKERQSVNYIYFGIFFLFLAILHIYHIFLIEGTVLHRFFYTIYAIGQSALEVGVLIVISHFLAERLHKAFNTIFLVLTFLLLLVHIVDFPLVRIMGMSFWYALGSMLAESFENFIELLYATHISMTSWMLAGLACILIPLLGVIFIRFTQKLAEKRPIQFSYSVIGLSLFSTLVFLALFDYKINTISAPLDGKHFAQALPWKSTFFAASYPQIKMGKLPPETSEKEFTSQLMNTTIKVAKKPNIFLFITESLREDYITKEIAPSLSKFRENNIAFRHSLSGANVTGLSWFSIFHSVYPFYWEARQPYQWSLGSLPLQILKKAGYQIHVYSSSRLNYYQMDERLFGKDRHLADTFRCFGEGEDRDAHENDTECVATLLENLGASQEGQVFIVFLESTHFGYSFPKQENLYPAPENVDYFNLMCSHDQLEGVKNRYRNAIHFIDRLFGHFVEKLKNVPGGQEAVVVFTGDHGEEFFEQGRVFHASNLNTMQTHVPIYYRLGSFSPSGPRELSSHLDIFPTILHHVLGDEPFKSHFKAWFNGISLLHPQKREFTVTARYNGPRAPFEFLLHNGSRQLTARFENPYNIFKSRALHLISTYDEEDKSLSLDLEEIQRDFKRPLETLFMKD